MKIEIKNRVTGNVLISGNHANIKKCLEENKTVNLRYADLRGADLEGACLRYAYLRYADLEGAYLRYADLTGADLAGIKNYSENREIFQEIVRRQSIETFTSPQWVMIGQILIYRLCWESIEKRYGKKFLTVLNKIKKLGFGEYYDRYKKML